MPAVPRARERIAAGKRKLTGVQTRARTSANGKLARHRRISALADLVRLVIRTQSRERSSLAAAGAAFWLIIAIFPAAIAAVNIYGLVLSPSEVAADLTALASQGSGSEGAALAGQLEEAASSDRTTLSISLVVSIAISVWSASAGAYSLARAIQLSYGMAPLGYLRARSRSLVAGLVGVMSLGLLALGASMLTVWVTRLSGAWRVVMSVLLGGPLTALVLTALIVGVFRYAIARRVGLRRLLPGALVSGVSLTVLAVGFGIYVDHFANYSAVYGTVAGIVIAMLLAYMSVYAILLSAIMNAHLGEREAAPARVPEP